MSSRHTVENQAADPTVIRQAQAMLSFLQYGPELTADNKAKSGIDGKMGDNTHTAIYYYQNNHKLTPTAALDPQTLEHLTRTYQQEYNRQRPTQPAADRLPEDGKMNGRTAAALLAYTHNLERDIRNDPTGAGRVAPKSRGNGVYEPPAPPPVAPPPPAPPAAAASPAPRDEADHSILNSAVHGEAPDAGRVGGFVLHGSAAASVVPGPAGAVAAIVHGVVQTGRDIVAGESLGRIGLDVAATGADAALSFSGAKLAVQLGVNAGLLGGQLVVQQSDGSHPITAQQVAVTGIDAGVSIANPNTVVGQIGTFINLGGAASEACKAVRDLAAADLPCPEGIPFTTGEAAAAVVNSLRGNPVPPSDKPNETIIMPGRRF